MLAVPTLAHPQSHDGELAPGDHQLSDGRYFDTYGINATGGQTLIIDLYSETFDTQLFVRAPILGEHSNDDYEGRSATSTQYRSHLAFPVTQSGTWTLYVTSSDRVANDHARAGSYRLEYRLIGGVAAIHEETGTLALGDEKRNNGSYVDKYTYDARPGDVITFDLNTQHFDPMLTLHYPDRRGVALQNDDYLNDSRRSLIRLEIQPAGDAQHVAGQYAVHVTSLKPQRTGEYSLSIRRESTDPAYRPVFRQGSLGSGDDRLPPDNKYADHYSFHAISGDRLLMVLESAQFDTVLEVVGPHLFAQRADGDDLSRNPYDTRLMATLRETGEYTAIVTSYGEKEVGDYTLRIETSPTTVGVHALELDRQMAGEISAADMPIRSGHFTEVWSIDMGTVARD